MQFPFFISILKSHFTSRHSPQLIRSIRNGLTGDPGGLEWWKQPRVCRPLEDTGDLILEENSCWARRNLSRGPAQPFSSIGFHPWLARQTSQYLKSHWSYWYPKTCRYVHVITSPYRNPKGDMHRGTGKSTCLYTGHVQMQTCEHSETDANL